MSKDVLKEVKAKVLEIMTSVGHDPRDWNNDSRFESFLIYGRVETDRLEVIERQGGEAEGEYACTVFTVDGVFYKAEYRYFSHVGYDFNYMGVYEVTPKETTITVYTPV
jgi:hypothetical protein